MVSLKIIIRSKSFKYKGLLGSSETNMRLLVLLSLSVFGTAGCSATPKIEFDPPVCGQESIEGKVYEKLCLTRDFKEPHELRFKVPKFIQILVGAGHTASSSGSAGAILDFSDKVVDMKGYTWDFSNQKVDDHLVVATIIRGENTKIYNGKINLPSTNGFFIYGNDDYSYDMNHNAADIDNFSAVKGRNMHLTNMSINSRFVAMYSESGQFKSSKFKVSSLFLVGSRFTNFSNNHIANQSKLHKSKNIDNILTESMFIHKIAYIDNFKHKEDAIPTSLYVKFSPDTVIDGNTFVLDDKNKNSYAIVLDHSKRVRITNNTFRGFKVPILMDQWSSIIDENGKEITAKDFARLGNQVIH